MLTEEQQENFYYELSNRDSRHRYYELHTKDEGLVGLGGLAYLSWENGHGEISLILREDCRGRGFGRTAVDLLLREGFGKLRLNMVYGECYWCNKKGMSFWSKVGDWYDGYATRLPARKFHDNQYHDSYWFSITREQWEGNNEKPL
jgi:RimJ/RimL family protein N-acetyltransferase